MYVTLKWVFWEPSHSNLKLEKSNVIFSHYFLAINFIYYLLFTAVVHWLFAIFYILGVLDFVLVHVTCTSCHAFKISNDMLIYTPLNL